MKYTKGGFPFKTDLTKKSGFGPIEIHKDDQSKRAAKSRYEMGKYKIDPTETNAETERREDAAGVGTGSNRKVMKDGPKNRVHGAGNTGNWQPNQFKK
jgi:hypothetical protein